MSDPLAPPGPFVLEVCRAAELSVPEFASERWLSPAERAALAAFPSEKRRRDWLAGRVAAKRALSRLWDRPALQCAVAPDASGRPRPEGLAGDLSITHCDLGAAAAASKTARVGVDWEVVAERPARVVELFAREDERGLVADAASQTRLWALKEAALKLLGVGLTGGAHEARLSLADGAARVEFFGAARSAWKALGAPEIRFFETRIARQADESSCLAVAHTGG